MICGSATLDLPVPELVPFRLTPQLTAILEPIGTSGLLEKSMVHVLRVLRNSKHILLACINVFVQDPIVDWFHLIKCSSGIEKKDIQAKLELRINSVQHKLEGYNPKEICISDLENSKINT